MREAQTRRRFLERSLVVLVATPVAAFACGGDDGGGNGGGGACDGVGATSSSVFGHSHTVCVPADDLMNPPASGATYETSVDDGHAHELTLSADELAELAGGGSVMVTTTLDDGHTHEFMLEER